MSDAIPGGLVDLCATAGSVAVLTGAGMSAQSGIPTFRDAQTGLWERYEPEAIATPEAWRRDPDLVWAWYQWRAGLVRRSRPNAGHLAIARWQSASDVRVATQNVDDLHERAGSSVAAHVHGSLFAPYCSSCTEPFVDPLEYPDEPVASLRPPECRVCGGSVRPGVVWFGEGLPRAAWEDTERLTVESEVVLVVGTSGVVYPFAGLPEIARDAGAHVVEINPAQTPVSSVAHQVWRTSASTALPDLVAHLLPAEGR